MPTRTGTTHPPYVDPCSPGLMQSMISLLAKTQDTGYTAMTVSDCWSGAKKVHAVLTSSGQSLA